MKKLQNNSSPLTSGRRLKKATSVESKAVVGIMLLVPALASLIVFKYVPLFMGAFISFFDFDIVNMPGEFVGLENYIRAFSDSKFYASLWHNVKMFAYTMIMNFWPPILLAILINEVKKGRTVFRLAYFIPACAPMIAMTIFWKYFWQPDYGLANYIVSFLGIKPQLWLNDTKLVYFCMHFSGLIICGGMNLVIYLAALQNVPQELYEASVIDGTNLVQRLRHITLPQIKDTVALMFMLSLINKVNAMEDIMVYTGGGPAGSTETALLYAYKQGTNSMDYSYAMTMITIVFVIVLGLNIINNARSGKEA